MEGGVAYEGDLNLKATELRLGLPGTEESEKRTEFNIRSNKRASPDTVEDCGSDGSSDDKHGDRETAPAAKAQVVGWPPIRSYRKNSFQPKKMEAETGIYVKVSMDGAPYLTHHR
uniref:Auxin-responsive protein n=1 Tax=Davidia involucrata TaxID=16924 RepID=A0A5B6YXV1_DAVIN